MIALICQVARVVTSHNGTSTHIKRTGGSAAGSVEADCAPGELGFGGLKGKTSSGFGGEARPPTAPGSGANERPEQDVPTMPELAGAVSKWLKPTATPTPAPVRLRRH